MKQTLLIIPMLWTLSPAAMADTADEIDHLLAFIENTGCLFHRNGEAHDAAAARAHIERKYAYGKGRLRTAEQFIQYAATKSSTSGEPYTVTCSGHEESSSAWLTRALKRFRGDGNNR